MNPWGRVTSNLHYTGQLGPHATALCRWNLGILFWVLGHYHLSC